MKKLLLLATLFFANCLFDSCSSDDVCVRIDIAEIRNYDLQNLSFASPGDTLDVQDLALLLEGETTSRVCLMPMSFGGSLMAEEPVYILENKITSLSIKSNATISAGLPAGTELIDYFELIEIDLDCIMEGDPTLSCIQSLSEESSIYTLIEILNLSLPYSKLLDSSNPSGDILGFRPKLFSVEEPLTHQFDIQIAFSDGNQLEFLTEEVFLE